MSVTPRTDAATGLSGDVVSATFARQLERELKDLAKERDAAYLGGWKQGMTDVADICDTVDASMPMHIILAARNLRNTIP